MGGAKLNKDKFSILITHLVTLLALESHNPNIAEDIKVEEDCIEGEINDSQEKDQFIWDIPEKSSQVSNLPGKEIIYF